VGKQVLFVPAFGCNQAFTIQRYTTWQMDVWYNLYFAREKKKWNKGDFEPVACTP